MWCPCFCHGFQEGFAYRDDGERPVGVVAEGGDEAVVHAELVAVRGWPKRWAKMPRGHHFSTESRGGRWHYFNIITSYKAFQALGLSPSSGNWEKLFQGTNVQKANAILRHSQKAFDTFMVTANH